MLNSIIMKTQLKKFIEDHCILRGTFTLSSGVYSNKYFDLKKALLDDQFSILLAQYIFIDVRSIFRFIDAIGGYGMGGALMTSVFLFGGFKDEPLKGMIIREPKTHGTEARIENTQKPGSRILVVDDVLTTGATIETACDEFLKTGYKLDGVFVIVDRSDGKAKRRLKNKFNVSLMSVFEEKEFDKPSPN